LQQARRSALRALRPWPDLPSRVAPPASREETGSATWPHARPLLQGEGLSISAAGPAEVVGWCPLSGGRHEPLSASAVGAVAGVLLGGARGGLPPAGDWIWCLCRPGRRSVGHAVSHNL
jgi:hypothetical protein